MNQSFKTLLLWIFSILLLVAAFNVLTFKREATQALSFTEFIQLVKENKVKEVTFRGKEKIYGRFKTEFREGALFNTIGDTQNEYFIKILADAGIVPAYESDETGSFWKVFFVNYLPIILIFLFLFFIYRQIQIGGGKALSFGKSRARLQKEGGVKITFQDVAGIDEAKDECQEIIEFLKNPKKFSKLGGRIPKGVLLMGAPGTGKTLLARAIAGEAGVPFFSISGSDFVEMFVGVGASRVRDLFDQGKKNAPCIIFIDEIDAVGRHRGAGLGGGHDEREQTLNQLLVEMDGFEANAGVILIAATNRPDVLDPALLRPGRFDRRIVVPLPDAKGRMAILKVHTRKIPLEANIHLDHIAKGTPGFSGADIENLVNEAALIAARRNHEKVIAKDIEYAKDKVLMGSERRSMALTEEEKRTTAYHESGHTLIAKLLPNMDPIHKVSIIPRGRALGVTQTLPSEEKYTMSKTHAENLIAFMMGGRVAEELVFGHRTTGAGDDIDKATHLSRRMVCEWGMSDRVGPVAFGKKDEHIFLGREVDRGDRLSEQTQQMIDQEMRTIIETQHERTTQMLRENLPKLHLLAKALMEREVLISTEVDALLAGQTLPPVQIEQPAEIEPTPVSQAAESQGSEKSKKPRALKVKPEPGKA